MNDEVDGLGIGDPHDLVDDPEELLGAVKTSEALADMPVRRVEDLH